MYFIVEHPTRGCYTKTEYGKHKCSWSVTRTDPKVAKFDRASAVNMAAQIRGSYVLCVDKTKSGTDDYIKRI